MVSRGATYPPLPICQLFRVYPYTFSVSGRLTLSVSPLTPVSASPNLRSGWGEVVRRDRE
jgi:hypothetical protein